jgi:branched-chain amino acid aminotransferase
MLSIDWDFSNGWHKPQIIPYGPIQLANTATSLHYGISVHEGISSCMNSKTGVPQAFRPELHLNSFLKSTEHIDMPIFDKDELLGCIKKLV